MWSLFKKNGKDPKINGEEQVRESSNEYRKRGQEILSELQMVRFPIAEERRQNFDQEKLRNMEQIVEGCKSVMSNPLPSEIDTAEIDSNIKLLIVQLRSALEAADEKAAYAICGYIGKSITEFRSDFERINEQSIENELKSRGLRTKQMVVLAGFHNQIKALRETINQLNTKIDVRKKEYENIYKEVQNTKKKFPELEMAVEEGLVNKNKINGLMVEYNNQKARAVSIYKDIENLTTLRSEKDTAFQKIEAAIQQGEMVLMDSSGRIDSTLVQEIQSIEESFQEQLADNMKVTEDLQKAEDSFQAMLDNFASDTRRINRMIRNEMEFAEMERERRRVEQIRKKGKQRQIEEEQKLKEEQKTLEEEQTVKDTEETEDAPQFIEI